MIANELVIYQFGDPRQGASYLFARYGESQQYSIDLKTQTQDSPFIQGDIRLNGLNANKKKQYEFSVDFIAKETDEANLLKNIFSSGQLKKMFFFSREANENIKIYWQWAECTNLEILYTGNRQVDTYSCKFRLQKPFVYEATEDLYLLDPSVLTGDFWNLTSNWNSTSQWNSSFYNQMLGKTDFNNLSIATKNTYLNKIDPDYFFTLVDRFINREISNWPINLLTFTEDLSNAIWLVDGGVLKTAGQLDRFGRNTASLIDFVTTGKRAFQRTSTGSVVLNQAYTASTYVKGTAGQTFTFRFVALDVAFTTLQTFSTAVTLTGGWDKITVTGTPTNASTVRLQFDYALVGGQTALQITVSEPQLEVGSIAGFYQARPTAITWGWMPSLKNALVSRLTSNTTVTTTSQPLDLASGFESNKLMIMISGGLATNEFIQIYNQTTKTGFKLIWTASASVSNSLV